MHYSIIVAECKRRWKNLRDRYFKLKKDDQAGKKSGTSAARNKASWKFMKIMEFLLPFTVTRRYCSSIIYHEINCEINNSLVIP